MPWRRATRTHRSSFACCGRDGGLANKCLRAAWHRAKNSPVGATAYSPRLTSDRARNGCEELVSEALVGRRNIPLGSAPDRDEEHIIQSREVVQNLASSCPGIGGYARRSRWQITFPAERLDSRGDDGYSPSK